MRIVEPDGRAHSAGPLIETLEKDLDALVATVERVLACIREDVVPVFERHGDFYVSVNIPPSIIGTGRLRGIAESLDLVHWGKRIVVELTERQALSDEGRAAVQAWRAKRASRSRSTTSAPGTAVSRRSSGSSSTSSRSTAA